MSRASDDNPALVTGQRLIGLVFITIGALFLLLWLAEINLAQQSAGQWPSASPFAAPGYSGWLKSLRWLAYAGTGFATVGTPAFVSTERVGSLCSHVSGGDP